MTNYSFVGIVTNSRTGETMVAGDDVDFIKDANTLRSRLIMELEKVEDKSMGSFLSEFSTETLLLHKQDQTTYKFEGIVDRNTIQSDDIDVNIEEGDIIERTLPKGAKEFYRVVDRGFFRGDHGIPDNYQTEVKKISQSEAERVMADQEDKQKPHKLFISHSSKDADYVEAFVGLLETLGLHEDEIICSSVPPYCIPLDNKVYDWLVKEFQQSDLHVVYALSEDYYRSAASLNEMGAAWAMKQKWTGILMPGFSFANIAGCIDPTQIGIKLDDTDRRTLNYRLGELKDNLTTEFGLRPMSATVWERKRDEFLEKIGNIIEKRSREAEETDSDEEDHTPIVGVNNVGNIPVDVAFLLVYAAAGNGQIVRVQTLGASPQISASGKQFMKDQSHKESARWQEALDTLINWGWVKAAGRKGQVFELTGTGYKNAEWLKDGMQINTDNEPLAELEEFE